MDSRAVYHQMIRKTTKVCGFSLLHARWLAPLIDIPISDYGGRDSSLASPGGSEPASDVEPDKADEQVDELAQEEDEHGDEHSPADCEGDGERTSDGLPGWAPLGTSPSAGTFDSGMVPLSIYSTFLKSAHNRSWRHRSDTCRPEPRNPDVSSQQSVDRCTR